MEEYFKLGSEWIQKNDNIWQIGEAIVFLLFLISVFYLFIFSIFSLRKRKYFYPEAKKNYRFAVLFTANKGDDVIINSIRSFLLQDYPKDCYDIYVVTNGDFDAAKLDGLSVHIVEYHGSNYSKTNAIRTVVDHIDSSKTTYDMVVIINADNTVDANYLHKLNDSFYSGCSAVQTHRVAKNRNTSIAVLDAVSEEINNSIFRKGHTELGFSCGLMGSGMAFEYELFRNSIHIASDAGIEKQLELILLKQNIYIEYLEDVYTYDEKVANSAGFYQQRRRWLATQFANLLSGIGSMPMAMLRGNWDYCNKLFQWMMPPRVILFGFIVLISILLTWFDWIMAIKWWGLLLLLCITFSVAIPDYLVDRKLRNAVLSLPILFILMFFNLFRLRGANKD